MEGEEEMRVNAGHVQSYTMYSAKPRPILTVLTFLQNLPIMSPPQPGLPTQPTARHGHAAGIIIVIILALLPTSAPPPPYPLSLFLSSFLASTSWTVANS
jgi:hypothetical protein